MTDTNTNEIETFETILVRMINRGKNDVKDSKKLFFAAYADGCSPAEEKKAITKKYGRDSKSWTVYRALHCLDLTLQFLEENGLNWDNVKLEKLSRYTLNGENLKKELASLYGIKVDDETTTDDGKNEETENTETTETETPVTLVLSVDNLVKKIKDEYTDDEIKQIIKLLKSKD